ncbi:MAG TPA: LysR substrate-binding domain-containing protein [Ruania sp.]|nr:LysR substrate-binding domain-containing protein [Ruania sp.]
MIDPRLQMLQMVAQHGTVTQAAAVLHYTPSTVSHQLKQLAGELRVPLLEQHGRRVRLTPAARTLLRHVEKMTAQWEQARSDLEAQTDTVSGTLSLCGFSTAASVLLPKTMLALNREFPELSTRMIEAEPAECYDLILAGEADMGIVVLTSSTPPQSDARFEQRHLIDDPLDLMVPLGHRLAERSRVSLAEAAGERWIVGRPGTTYYQLVMGSCTAAGFTPDIAHHADEWETGTALVADGFGVCLVSRLAQWPDNHPVMRIPLRGAHTPARRVVVVTRAGAQGRKSIELALSVLTQTAGRLMDSLRADLGG